MGKRAKRTLIAILIAPATAWGMPLFGEPRAYPVGTSPIGIVAAELDGMPGLDLATADEGNTISILANRGDGVFKTAAHIAVASRYTASGIVAGHFNTDALDDFAIAADDSESFPGFAGAVVIYRSSAALHYGTTGAAIGLFPTCITLGDITGDGIPDLTSCTTDSDGGGLASLLQGKPDGTFTTTAGIPLGSIVPGRFVVADIDHDAQNRPDLLVLDTSGDAVWILYANGPGPTFDVPVRLATIDEPSAATVAVIQSGTLPSIAIASRLDGQVLVFRQPSARVFAAPVAYTTGLLPVDLVAADFNGDHTLDLLCANNGSNDVTLLAGNGDGTFQSAERVGVGAGPVALVAGDFNSDNKIDFATANQDDQTFGRNTQSVSVVLNGVSPSLSPTPTATATATASPNRTPTGPRFATPTPTAFPGTPTPTRTPAGPADVNCDGRSDPADLDTVVAQIFGDASWCVDRDATAADLPLIVDLLTTTP